MEHNTLKQPSFMGKPMICVCSTFICISKNNPANLLLLLFWNMGLAFEFKYGISEIIRAMPL